MDPERAGGGANHAAAPLQRGLEDGALGPLVPRRPRARPRRRAGRGGARGGSPSPARSASFPSSSASIPRSASSNPRPAGHEHRPPQRVPEPAHVERQRAREQLPAGVARDRGRGGAAGRRRAVGEDVGGEDAQVLAPGAQRRELEDDLPSRASRSERRRAFGPRTPALVAAIQRTSTFCGASAPTGVSSPCSRTRRSLTWAASGISPISSSRTLPCPRCAGGRGARDRRGCGSLARARRAPPRSATR